MPDSMSVTQLPEPIGYAVMNEHGECAGVYNTQAGAERFAVMFPRTYRVEPLVLRSSLSEEREARTKLHDGMEVAWGIIANVSVGDWTRQNAEWQEAAARWRDEHWHPSLKSRAGSSGDVPPAPNSPTVNRLASEEPRVTSHQPTREGAGANDGVIPSAEPSGDSSHQSEGR